MKWTKTDTKRFWLIKVMILSKIKILHLSGKLGLLLPKAEIITKATPPFKTVTPDHPKIINNLNLNKTSKKFSSKPPKHTKPIKRINHRWKKINKRTGFLRILSSSKIKFSIRKIPRTSFLKPPTKASSLPE